MDETRDVDWQGFFNTRDLGGLGSASPGRIYRAGTVEAVTSTGWQQAVEAGVTTVVDLRDDDEVAADRPVADPPASIRVVHVDLDDRSDEAFWADADRIDGTPLVLGPFLRGKPERVAAAVRCIAHADPGAVVFHCGAGRDRTGIVAVVLLSLAGASPAEIADDYARSAPAVSARARVVGGRDEQPLIDAILAREGTSTQEVVSGLASGFDAEAYLLRAGLSEDEVEALRSRLTDA
ncbi:Tyrosine-protein phosphatase [Frondihabitans sp. 762G35]|nr:Tyrosine-protein phosphatase [Frondihabitans sp. 762G35]